MPSKTSLFLIASLAVNAALLGMFGGRLLGGTKEAPPQTMSLERYGPTSDVVAAAWAQLPAADRDVLKKQFHDRWEALKDDRKRLGDAGKTVYDTALAEPFDEVKLRDAVTIFQQRETRMQQSAEDILISHLGKMPAQARANAAVGLLTPFNARVQRREGKDGKDGRDGARQPGGPGGPDKGLHGPPPGGAANGQGDAPQPPAQTPKPN